jgi:hypothetical protein
MNDRNPARGRPSFICPHCKSFTQQSWWDLAARQEEEPGSGFDKSRVAEIRDKAEADAETATEASEKQGHKILAQFGDAILQDRPGLIPDDEWAYSQRKPVRNMALSVCFACEREAVWVNCDMIYPAALLDVPPANEDLTADVAADYTEAAKVLAVSPRAAAALLRLALQKLCDQLVIGKDDINAKIGTLVSRGLNAKIQRALDVVRVVGNEAVHPGTMDLKDNRSTALKLFGLVNIVADAMITQPKHVDELYSSLPASKRDGIEQRDKKALADSSGDGSA